MTLLLLVVECNVLLAAGEYVHAASAEFQLRNATY